MAGLSQVDRGRLSAPASGGGGGASAGTAPGAAPGAAPVIDKPLTRDEARVALEATRRALAGVVASAAVAAYAFVTRCVRVTRPPRAYGLYVTRVWCAVRLVWQ